MRTIESFSTPGGHATRPGAVILVDRGAKGVAHRYVTAWRGTGDDSWCWGHYFNDLDEARADFTSRCKRGY